MLQFPVCHWGGIINPHFRGNQWGENQDTLLGVADSNLFTCSVHFRHGPNEAPNNSFIDIFQFLTFHPQFGLEGEPFTLVASRLLSVHPLKSFEGGTISLTLFYPLQTPGFGRVQIITEVVNVYDEEWHHVVFSVNSVDDDSSKVFLDGVDKTNTNPDHNPIGTNFGFDNITETQIANTVSVVGRPMFDSCLQELWIEFGVFFDLTNPVNLSKFDFGTLGLNGENPTGSTPALFFKGGQDFLTNKGDGGAFTQVGTVVDCPAPLTNT